MHLLVGYGAYIKELGAIITYHSLTKRFTMNEFNAIEKGTIDWFNHTKYLYCNKDLNVKSPINTTTKVVELAYKALTNIPSSFTTSKKDIKNILDGFLEECDLIGFNFNVSWIWDPQDNKGEYCLIPIFFVDSNNCGLAMSKHRRIKNLANIAQSLKAKVFGIGISPVFVFPIYFCLNRQIVNSIYSIYSDENESYFIPTIIDINSKTILDKKTSFIQSLFSENNWVKKSRIPEFINF